MKNRDSRGEINRVHISPFYTKYSRVPSSKDGILCNSSQFVEYSAKETIYSSEFSLGNLIAIGAAGNLQYVSMSVNSDMNFVDSFATSYDSLKSDVTKTL